MNSFVAACFLCLSGSALSAPQFPAASFHGDPSLAKILQEQRFNVGNDQFGHAAQQEDGVIIKEETTSGNNRIGQYQYVGDDGQLYTVKYEAGVNGFRIIGGDHIPSGGQGAADAVVKDPETGEDVEYDYAYYDDAIPDSPFVNPYDPSHQQPDLIAGNLAGHLAGLYRLPEPKPEDKLKKQLRPVGVVPDPVDRTRFFPPGELKFERFADGFNYNFRSN